WWENPKSPLNQIYGGIKAQEENTMKSYAEQLALAEKQHKQAKQDLKDFYYENPHAKLPEGISFYDPTTELKFIKKLESSPVFGQPSWKDAWNYMEAKNKETGVNIGTSNYLSTFLTDPNNTTTPKQAMTLFDKT